MPSSFRKYLMEFIGTFGLLLLIVLTAHNGSGDMAPVAIGLGLMGLIYAGGHISAAHYNPAVSLAFLLRGRMPGADFLPYIVAQLLGAALAGWLGAYLLQHSAGAPPISAPPEVALWPLLLAELIGTFILAFVILHVATAKRLRGNSFYGLAIGMTVIGLIYALGPLSGALLNPAVGVGLAAANIPLWAHISLYVVGQFSAAGLAALAFRLTHGPD